MVYAGRVPRNDGCLANPSVLGNSEGDHPGMVSSCHVPLKRGRELLAASHPLMGQHFNKAAAVGYIAYDQHCQCQLILKWSCTTDCSCDHGVLGTDCVAK